MSIVMGMQTFIKINQKDQEIGPVSLFSEFGNLGKTSTNPKCHLTISWATSCQYQCVCKISSQYSSQFQEIGPFSLFQKLELGKASTDKNVSSQSLGLDLVNINVYAKVYQNIPLSSRDRAIFTFFQNLALGKASTDDKCHFAIPWARSFQHQIVCKILSKHSNGLRVVSLFSEFEPRQKLNQSQMSFDNLMGFILSISMCMQNFITIFHSVQEIGPFPLFRNLELGKTSTDEK